MTELLFAALMLTFGGCVFWGATWLRRYVLPKRGRAEVEAQGWDVR